MLQYIMLYNSYIQNNRIYLSIKMLSLNSLTFHNQRHFQFQIYLRFKEDQRRLRRERLAGQLVRRQLVKDNQLQLIQLVLTTTTNNTHKLKCIIIYYCLMNNLNHVLVYQISIVEDVKGKEYFYIYASLNIYIQYIYCVYVCDILNNLMCRNNNNI